LPPGGILSNVCSEKRVLFIGVIIHPFTEVIPNVESPEKERERGRERGQCRSEAHLRTFRPLRRNKAL
jgi:hypothetical protein